MSTKEEALEIVTAFHEYLNARETAKLLDLATDDIRIGGSRGSGTGKDLLREWVDDAAAVPEDLEQLAHADEQSWREEREGFLLYS